MKAARETGRERRLAGFGLSSGLFFLNLYAQIHYLGSRPQPLVIGDPGAHYEIAQNWWQAAKEALREGYPVRRRAFRRLERYALFAVPASIYGGVDALVGQGPRGIYTYHAVVGAGAGVLLFFAVYRLSTSLWGGLLAQVAHLLYVPFIVISGLTLPEPTIVVLGAAGLAAYAQGWSSGRTAWLVVSGFLTGFSFLVRPQSASYLLFLLGGIVLALYVFGRGAIRRGSSFFGLGLLVPAVLWGFLLFQFHPSPALAERYGFWNYDPPYDIGFWLFLENDGWVGPLGFHEYPYGRAFEAEAARVPALRESFVRQKLFTLRYVAGRPLESVRAVVLNIYRFLRFPDNPFEVNYIFSYPIQVIFHQALVFAAFVFAPLAYFQARPLLPLYAVPGFLIFLYPLYHIFTKYNVPMMPYVIVAAVSAIVFVGRRLRHAFAEASARRPAFAKASARRPAFVKASARLAVVSLVFLAGAFVASPNLAHAFRVEPFLVLVLRLSLACAFVGTLLWLFGRQADVRGWSRLALVATALFLLVPFVTHELHYYNWHEVRLSLADGEYEQRLELGPVGRQALASADEAFLLFDIQSNTQDLSPLEIRLGDRVFSGSALRPTMLSYGAATWVGGRPGETVPQWWALPLDAGSLQNDELAVHLRWRANGDRAPWLFADVPSVLTRGRYDGPSFGDAANISAYKLRHDGNYRLAVNLRLESLSTRSYRDGRELFAELRIRAVVLTSDLGGIRWKTPVLSTRRPTRLAFEARSGAEGPAALDACEQSLFFELGAESPRTWRTGSLELSTEPAGSSDVARYELSIPESCVTPGRPLSLAVRYLAGMRPAQSLNQRFFLPQAPSSQNEGAISGFAETESFTPYRHWTAERVF